MAAEDVTYGNYTQYKYFDGVNTYIILGRTRMAL